jgi:hypothetical protein
MRARTLHLVVGELVVAELIVAELIVTELIVAELCCRNQRGNARGLRRRAAPHPDPTYWPSPPPAAAGGRLLRQQS